MAPQHPEHGQVTVHSCSLAPGPRRPKAAMARVGSEQSVCVALAAVLRVTTERRGQACRARPNAAIARKLVEPMGLRRRRRARGRKMRPTRVICQRLARRWQKTAWTATGLDDTTHHHDSSAEWSEALAACARPRGRRFDSHSCHASYRWAPRSSLVAKCFDALLHKLARMGWSGGFKRRPKKA